MNFIWGSSLAAKSYFLQDLQHLIIANINHIIDVEDLSRLLTFNCCQKATKNYPNIFAMLVNIWPKSILRD